jgi:dienelactone hydrolase
MRSRFTFQSEGEALVGDLFLPEGAEPSGVVVAVGPLTSVKEQASGTYAQAMAERGYAALAFDYRSFGESDGRPRQLENPDAHIEDIRNAASALLADKRLTNLPLFGLGICCGRRMSSTGRRAVRCPTTSTATRCSRSRTACRSTRAARRT